MPRVAVSTEGDGVRWHAVGGQIPHVLGPYPRGSHAAMAEEDGWAGDGLGGRRGENLEATVGCVDPVALKTFRDGMGRTLGSGEGEPFVAEVESRHLLG